MKRGVEFSPTGLTPKSKSRLPRLSQQLHGKVLHFEPTPAPTSSSGVGGSKFTPAVEWKREDEGILLEFIAMKQLQGEFELEKWPGTNLRDN